MDHSLTLSLSSLNKSLTGISPFELTLNPAGISVSNKVYKIEYDFGDGTIVNQILTPDSDGDPLKITKTHVYYLTGDLQKTFNINVNAYQFNTSLYNNYKFSLNLKAPPIESINVSNSASHSSYFDELHLVGSRMFGTDNEVLYMFESINPNYVLPVMVNWKSRPLEAIVRTIDNSYSPYKLLAPFENEFVTSIDTGTNIVTFPDVDAAPNPDYGSPSMALYEGDGIATMFLGTVDGNWFNLANWKTDGNNNPLFLPDEYVSVKIYAPLNLSAVNTGEVKTIDFYQNSLLSQLTIMAAQSAIFRSNSYNLGTIDGNAYFLDNSYNQGFEPTLLLLNGEGVDGSHTFTDSSTYNRILTYTGNPVVTSIPVTPNTVVSSGLAFQVDAQGYIGDGSTWIDSVSGVVGTAINSPVYVADSPSYFDFSGASQCFNFTRYNSAVNLNNNFTLEAWVNVRGNNEWGGIISLATGGYENYGRGYGEQYSLNTTYGQYFRFDVNSGSYLNGTGYSLNNWTHVVATYESGVVKTYKNGILADTQTIASTANTIIDAYLALGVNQYGGYEYLNGKIATVRIYNKVLSSYEASQNFNATKERFGITRPIGSFMYFNGSSYINPVSGGGDFAFGKEDFTIEAWIYPSRTDQGHIIYDTRTSYAPVFPVLYIRYGILAYFDGSGDRIYGTDYIPVRQWSHVALSRNGKNTRIFLNGKQTGGTFIDNNTYQSPSNRPMIGQGFDGGPYYGFIEDLRVTKGIAKYTGSYNIPTSSLTVDPYITGDVTGTAFFRDNSINYGTLTNTAFSGNCQNLGTVVNADVYYPTPYPFGGNVTGSITYHGYVFGCDDPDASNYNPLVNMNNGSCTYTSINPLSALVAYWTLDEVSGTRYDVSGNGLDVTEVGTIASGTGKISDAALFEGNWYQYLTNGTFEITAGSNFTVCGWVNLNSAGFQELIGEWYGGYAGNFVITYGESGNNSLGFHVVTSNGDRNIFIETPINEWVFFAMRWRNGVKLQAKINNSAWHTLNDNGTLNGKNWTTFMIGAGESYGYYPVNGSLDEIGIWNRTLNEGEISYLYNSGIGRTYPF